MSKYLSLKYLLIPKTVTVLAQSVEKLILGGTWEVALPMLKYWSPKNLMKTKIISSLARVI